MAATVANTTWVSPRNWTTGETVTSTIMNAHVRDQLTALKTPASFYYVVNEASNYTTTSTSFVDVDATNLAATITTGGGMVVLCWRGAVGGFGSPQKAYFDVLVDGARLGLDDGLLVVDVASSVYTNATFIAVATGLAAGSHTFKLQWKVSGSTGTIPAGAGTASYDVHPCFFGWEIG